MSSHSIHHLLFTCSLMALAGTSAPFAAHANPQDGVITAGSATIVTNGTKLDIHQSTDKAVIDWRNFDIDAGEETEFHQLNSKSIALNRVNSNKPSAINGKLSANGNVVIVNQNGVMFGAGSQVDVNGLVVSTSDIDNNNFMNGNLNFDKAGNPNAKIVNAGTITAKDAGLVGFVAPHVENSGVIVANLGRVHLASGSKATVDLYGDGLMEVEVSDDVTSQIVQNTGTIEANGGKIALTAAAGKNIVNNLIQAAGVIKAQSIGAENGEIIIGSVEPSTQATPDVIISGTLDASGKLDGQTGGSITATGKNIALTNTAKLDTSGHSGGGSIKLGGDYQGKGITPTAKTLTVASGAKITNDAIQKGNGGRTILWSDEDTVFRGLITARGGSASGDGGFAEVSGKSTLLYSGLVDLSASNGEFGTLLLDPTDITISNSPDDSISGTTSIVGTGATSNINITTLQNQLASANVTISTTSPHTGGGNITVIEALTWSSGRTLTLDAERDVNIYAAVTAGNSGGLTINAGRDIGIHADVSTPGAGALTATATRNFTVSSGATISSGTTGSISLRAAGGVATNAGVLNMNGTLAGATGGLILLSGVDGSGNRTDLTLNTTNFLPGVTIGAINISGFRDITIDRDLSNVGNMTIAAYRNLTINAGRTLTNTSNSNISLRAANGVVGDLGLLTLNGGLSMGTGTLILTSGVDGSGNRADLTFNSTNFTMQGATIGLPTITGFRDITLNRDLISSGNVFLTAYRNLTVGNGVTVKAGSGSAINLTAANAVAGGLGVLTMNGILNAGSTSFTLFSGVDGSGNRTDLTLNNSNFLMQGSSTSTFTLNGFRDISIDRNLTSSGSIVINANRNLTIGSGVTVQSNSSSAMTLNAAGGSATGIGILTNNGTLRAGTGTFTLTSGVDGSGNRSDLLLNSTNFQMQGATISTTSISGFRDITFNRNIAFSGVGSIAAYRNLTINSGVTLTSGATSSLTLRAANGVTSDIGLLSLNGAISMGTGVLTLASGVDGSGNRTDITLNNSTLLDQSGSFANLTLSGFRDVSVERNLSTTGAISITAFRNLTVAGGTTITPGSSASLTLRAANNVVTDIGQLIINGTINMGTGALTLASGMDGSGNRSNLTLNNTNFLMQAATLGTTIISGFNDISLDRDLAFSNNVNILANRNLTVGSGTIITSGASSTLSLRAANGTITNEGILTLNGRINAGTGALTLLSGVDNTGNAIDLTLNSANFVMQGASIGTTNISGFRDLNLNTAITFSESAPAITAERDMIVGSNAVLNGSFLRLTAKRNLTTQNGSQIQVNGFYLGAANGDITNTGILSLNGSLSTGTSGFNLVSGLDASGNAVDLVLDNSIFTMSGANIGSTNISGFRDITVNTSILSSNNIVIGARRNLTINTTLQTGATTGQIALRAANGSINDIGLLTINGNLNLGTGALILSSGVDTLGNRNNLILDSAKLSTQSATIGNVALDGFNDITFDRDISGSGYINAIANGNVIITNGTELFAGSQINLAGRNFINHSGSNALASNGSWYVYSTSPDNDTTGDLAYSFRSFGCSYGGNCSLGTGNGFFYSQSLADYDYNRIRSEFKYLPQTVEYVSQTPIETYKDAATTSAITTKQENMSTYTIDEELAEQLNIDQEKLSLAN